MNRSSAIAVATLLLSAAGAHAQSSERQGFQMIRASAASANLVQTRTQQPSAADQQTTQAAREAYYDLASTGFLGLHADVRPDWTAIMGQPPTTEDQPIFDGFKFQVAVDSNGNADMTATGSKVPDAYSESFLQIDETLTSMLKKIFSTWSSFTLARALPIPGTAYVLKREPKLYRYSFKEGDSQVSITLLKNFAITEEIVTGPGYTAKLVPVFTPTEDGFVVTAWDSEFIPTTDPTQRDLIRVDIAYQVVDGVKVPKRLVVSGTEAGTPVKLAVDLENIVVQKRTP